MMIRLRYGGETRTVDVRDRDCPRRWCFFPHTHTIRSVCGASGCSSRSTDWWECGRRDANGCPEDDHIAEEPRYVRRGALWREVGRG